MVGLGLLGLGNDNIDKAKKYFDEVLSLDVNHQSAAIHKQMISYHSLFNK